jgi:hypothetical protein
MASLRIVWLVAAFAAAISCRNTGEPTGRDPGDPVVEPGDPVVEPPGPISAERSVYDSLGAYSVVPLGPPPISGQVHVVGINDSGVVVGEIRETPGSPVTYPFRWKNGTYQLLSLGTAASAAPRAINMAGDVVGTTDTPVIWQAGSIEPVEIVPPESTTYRRALAVGISDNGLVLLHMFSSHSTAIVARSPFRVVTTWPMTSSPRMSSSGFVVARNDMDGLYTQARLWNPTTKSTCGAGAGHGQTTIAALNERGDLLTRDVNTGPGGFYSSFILVDSTCKGRTTVSPDAIGGVPVSLRSMNNDRWVVGMVAGWPSMGIVGMEGFAKLDSVLARSGEAAAAWHIVSAAHVSNRGVIVALATKAGEEPQTVLLVRAGSR